MNDEPEFLTEINNRIDAAKQSGLEGGYHMCMADVFDILCEVANFENVKLIEEVRQRMTHTESIRQETKFTLTEHP